MAELKHVTVLFKGGRSRIKCATNRYLQVDAILGGGGQSTQSYFTTAR